MSAKLIYVTTPNETEAQNLIRHLLEKRLIACANLIGGIKSFYWWNDEIQHDAECVFIAKTTEANLEFVTNEIIEQHSYDVPCVVALPIETGNPDFLKWIDQETV